jgi:hypothetical protein
VVVPVSARPPTDSPPATLRWAAALFLLYGGAVLLNALAMQAGEGWGEPWALPRAALRLLVSGVLAWGLLRRARWAWLLGLLWALFVLVLGGLALLVWEHGDIRWLAPSRAQVLPVAALVSLGGAIALLLTPSARGAVRGP